MTLNHRRQTTPPLSPPYAVSPKNHQFRIQMEPTINGKKAGSLIFDPITHSNNKIKTEIL
ncbi:hypothetical protein HanPSC8_Chr01g0031641 [Helianthus annuus]|nr:hypothetical protein HanPSC8_Chr01g0031641 [Helianthus annuus]